MKRALRVTWQLIRYVGGSVGSFILALVWMALVALLGMQVYTAVRHEVAVPPLILRQLEARAAEAGIKVTFDRATFDPTGRILVQHPLVYMPGYADPVIEARAAFVGLSPLSLALGRFDLNEIRVVHATTWIPAVLSPSGRTEPIVRDMDLVLLPGEREWAIRSANARIGGMLVTAHGAIAAAPSRQRQPPEAMAALVRARFAEFCRIAMDFTRRLDALEEPALDLAFRPVPGRGAMVSAELLARGARIEKPLALQATRLRVATELPLFGELPAAARVDAQVDEVRLPGGVEIRQLAARVRGRVVLKPLEVQPADVELTADAVTLPDGEARSISALARPRSLQQWDVVASGRLAGSELEAAVELDLERRAARARLAGTISPRVIEVVNRRARVDVRRFFDFRAMRCEQAVVEFAPGWKFQRLTAEASLDGIVAYGVQMEAGRATIELEPGRFHAPAAFARIGPNYARGSYTQVFATREFRFLLDGRLRPLAISRWFQDWWPRFFGRFEFPVVPPTASVDVRGVWRSGRRTSVFVFADAASPVVHGQPFERVRTRLFVRPGYYDGLELYGTDGNRGEVEGTFVVGTDMDTGKWRTIDVDARSTLPLEAARRVGGELGQPILSPFALANAPAVQMRGHFDGPAVQGVRHRAMRLEARTAGAFSFHHFPIEDVAFKAVLRDDELTVDSTEAKFAGGAVKLHAKVWGPPADRRIGFDASITHASLGTAVAALQKFSAERNGLPVPPPGKFVREKANVRIDIAASADGLYSDPYSLKGGGSAVVSGPEIGEVQLFGPLSELLRFTSLRFTNANTNFKINGAKLEFPEFSVRGNDAAIDAHGSYDLVRKQLDFRAKVFPFQESGGVLKAVVGAVLTPISNVLEVKLTGTLEKPEWAFVIGPTNLIRSLAADPEKDKPADPPAPTPPAAPAMPPVPNQN